MFTGIIESVGEIISVETKGTNTVLWVKSAISNQLKIDQSVAHSGICLTVEEVNDTTHRVTAIQETIDKTNLGTWQQGSKINLERCLAMHGRLDGHIVQGHVDTTAICTAKIDKNGSWEYTFEFPAEFGALVIEKGSICLNGTSLTIFNVSRNTFTVAIIPFTYEHTNIHQVQVGSLVNIEFDMIGKYVQRMETLKQG